MGDIKYNHIDQGICNVCNFEEILEKMTSEVAVSTDAADLILQ
jgi:hypothetical protein